MDTDDPTPLAAVGTVGIHCVRLASARPPTVSVALVLSIPMGPNGSVWKKPPLSPAGLRPMRRNSRAMYSVPL